MRFTYLFLGIGVLFGTFASAIAYIIFYREYVHHFADIKKARAMALRGALTAFLFFVVFSVTAGFVITQFVIPTAHIGP